MKEFIAKYRITIILGVIILIGALLRLYNLASVPDGLNQDEAIQSYDAWSLALTGRDHHGNYWPPMIQAFGDWPSTLITWIQIPFVYFTGLSIYSTRLANAILGILLIPVGYVLIKRITSHQSLALLAGLFFAVTPFLVSLSHWAIPPSIVPFFLLLFLLNLYNAANSTPYTKDSLYKWLIAGFSLAALVFTYPTMKLYGPILMLLTIALFWKQFRIHILYFASLFTVIVSPNYILPLLDSKYSARVTDTIIQGSILQKLIAFILQYFSYLTPYFLTGSGDANEMHHIPHFGSLQEWLTPFIFIGLIWLGHFLYTRRVELWSQISPWAKTTVLYRPRLLFYTFLLCAFIASPVPPAITRDFMISTRAVQVLVFALVFGVLGIWRLLLLLQKYKPTWSSTFITLCTCLTIVSSLFFGYYYFEVYPRSHRENFGYGNAQIFQFLREHRGEFDIVYINGMTQPYIYHLYFDKIDPATLDYPAVSYMNDNYFYYQWPTVGDLQINEKNDYKLPYNKEVEIIPGQIYLRVYQATNRIWLVDRFDKLKSIP